MRPDGRFGGARTSPTITCRSSGIDDKACARAHARTGLRGLSRRVDGNLHRLSDRRLRRGDSHTDGTDGALPVDAERAEAVAAGEPRLGEERRLRAPR